MKNIFKNKLFVASLLLSMLLLQIPRSTAVTLPTQPFEQRISLNALTPVPYIHIVNNFSAADALYKFPGDGTKFDPYIIENYQISLSRTDELGIYISSTTAYFIIRNNVIDHGLTGIHLNYTDRGTIDSNTITASTNGIVVEFSDYTSIRNNNLENNLDVGIQVEGSSSVYVNGNTLYSNDLNLNVINCVGASITNNNFFNGGSYDQAVFLRNTNSSLISGNEVRSIDYGFSFYNTNELEISSNIIQDTVTAIYVSQNNNTSLMFNELSFNNWGLILFEGHKLLVESNNLQHNQQAIMLRRPSDTTVINNSLFNNSQGIEVEYTQNTTLRGNIITDSFYYAILRDGVESMIIEDNIIINGAISTQGTKVEQFIYDHLLNNTINGLPIIFLRGVQDQVISGAMGQVILVESENITLAGMDFSNSGGITGAFSSSIFIHDNTFSSSTSPVSLYNVSQVEIRENQFSKVWNALSIYMANEVSIQHNTILKEQYGLLISNVQGLYMENNQFDHITGGLTFRSCVDFLFRANSLSHGSGLVLDTGTGQKIINNYFYNFTQIATQLLSDSKISSNHIINNTLHGLLVYYAENLLIENNEIVNASGYGLDIEGSLSTTVMGNNFIDNAASLPSQAYEDYSGQYVNYTANYWSDHTGTDSNGDGYFDQVYEIETYGPSPNTDIHPLVDPVIVRSSPTPVMDLQVSYVDEGLLLTWSPSSNTGTETIISYHIYRGTGEGEFQHLTTVYGTSYVDEEIEEGTLYSYKVKAENELGQSPISSVVSITSRITPNAPLPSVTSSDDYVVLEWTTPNVYEQQLIEYRIYRSETSGSDYVFIGSTVATSYVDTDVSVGSTYYYVITTLTDFKESRSSSEILVTVTSGQSMTETVTDTETSTIVSTTTIVTTIMEDGGENTTETSSLSYPVFWILPLLIAYPVIRKTKFK